MLKLRLKDEKITVSNKINVYWSLPLVPGTGFLKPFKLLRDTSTRSIFCSIEVTLGRLLNGSWMGAGHQQDQNMIRISEFSALPASPSALQQRGKGLQMGLMTGHTYVRKPP